MFTENIMLIGLTTVLSLAACAGEPAPWAERKPKKGEREELPLPEPTSDRCPLMEFVGIAVDGVCPDGEGFPTGWTISPLFANDLEHEYLQPFCRLVWTGAELEWGDIPQHFERIDQDCPVVVPQGNAHDWPSFPLDVYEQFQMGAGWPDLATVRATYGWDLGEVVVQVVDTIPHSPLRAEPRSPHGVYIRDLLQELLAGAGEELRHVRTTLGMPRAVVNGEIIKDTTRGGTFGTRGDLAEAIVSAVQDIEDEYYRVRGILVLALGWEQDMADRWLADADPDSWEEVAEMDLPADTKAVLMALRYAACQQVQVIAAAGNVQSDACVEIRPTGPAYFADLPKPCTDRRCGNDEAFVVPVTGIDAQGGFLATTRARGIAVNAALGAVVFPDGSSLVGSSVAAATFAAAQALGYVVIPEDWYVEFPYGGGVFPAPVPVADFGCSLDFDAAVERLSLCTDCDFHEEDALRRRWECELPHIIAEDAFAELRTDISDLLGDIDLCGPHVPFAAPGDGETDCEDHWPLLPPWTWPQPIDTICPKCQTLGLQHGPFYAVIAPNVPPGELSAMFVEMVVDGVVTVFDANEALHGETVLAIPRPEQGIPSFRLRYRRRVGGVEMTRVEALFKVEDGFDCEPQ